MKALICFRRLLVALLVLFVSGSVNRVCAQDVYELVTDVNSLVGGDNVIIVAAGNDKAMGGVSDSGNNRNAVVITKKDNYISLEDRPDVTVLTLEKSDSYWAFKYRDGDSDVYLCAASNSSNWLRTASSLKTAAAKASVTVNEDGVATVTFGSYTHNNLRYNKTNDLFSCYASGQKDISIYKKNVNAVIMPVIVISLGSGSYYGPQTVGLSVMGGGSIYYTLDGSEPNGASQLYTDSLSITEPCILKAKAIRNGTEGDVTTASYVISNRIDANNVKLLTDGFTGATLGLTGSYKDFNYTGAESLCKYAGHAALDGESAIEMTASSNGGIVTTTTCGRVMGATVTWTLNQLTKVVLEFYGSHTPYTSAADLYDDNKKGKLLGTINIVDTEEEKTKTIDLDKGYEYLGIRPKSGTFYAANVSITWAKTETVDIGSTGYATVYYQNEALKVPNGMTAYGFTYNEGTLQAVKMYDGIVPAGTGAVLYAPVTGAYMFECTDLTGTGVVGNCLSGTDEAQTVSAESGRKLYILGNGSKGLGFYLASQNGLSANNKAHKAYLSIPAAESKVRSFLSLDDDATPVLDIQGRHQPETVYSLSGVRMNATARPGVYIVNGKKMVKL